MPSASHRPRSRATVREGAHEGSLAVRVFAVLVRSEDPAAGPSTPRERARVARNGLRQVGANTLQGVGDQVVNAKTVLPWLLTALGAPGILLALLVPVRESGSMLPQAALSPWVRRHPVRKRIWVAGAAGQAFATAAMAVLAATTTGVVAGTGIVLALAGLAVSRSLSSLSGKDVLGRTIPQGQRGQMNGIVVVFSGAVALTLGLALRQLGGTVPGAGVIAALLGAAALAWVAALLVYAGVVEPVVEPVDETAATGATADDGPSWVAESWTLLRDDSVFRRFVLVRTLLLVSALSPPFIVAIAAGSQEPTLGGLGLFVIAQGVASLLGGRLFGRWADRSSRTLMVAGAAAAAVVVLAFLGVRLLPGAEQWTWLYPTAYLLLALIHIGARVARKTYVVDLAEGDRRTQYVAVANTAMGVLLLALGGITGALALLGNAAALLLLALLGLVGAAVGRSLPEVSRPSA